MQQIVKNNETVSRVPPLHYINISADNEVGFKYDEVVPSQSRGRPDGSMKQEKAVTKRKNNKKR